MVIIPSPRIPLGPYQKFALLGLLFPAIAVFYTIAVMPYMGIQPAMQCADSTGETYSQCTYEAACSSAFPIRVDKSASLINWVVSFDLECKSSVFLKLVYYFFLVGFGIGAALVSPLADYFGRKSLLLLSCVVVCLASLKAVFTTDVYTCAIVLLSSGICVGIYYTVSIAYLTEATTQTSAALYVCTFHLAFPLSGIIATLILMVSPDWKMPTTILAIMPLLLITYFAYIVESPRYLAARGEFDSARVATNRVAVFNFGKAKRWTFDREFMLFTRAFSTKEEARDKNIWQLPYLLNSSSMRFYLTGFGILLFCCGFSFGGLAFSQKHLFKNVFFDTIVLHAIEFGMILGAGILFHAYGHLKPILVLLLATGALGLCSSFTSWTATVGNGFFTYLTKLCSLYALLGSVTHAAETCPVRFRATGFGLIVGVCCLGVISGGIVLEFFENLDYLFGFAALVGVAGLKFTKEPLDYRTNDDIYEWVEERNKNFSGYKPRPEDDATMRHRMDSPTHEDRKASNENWSLKDLLKGVDASEGEKVGKSDALPPERSQTTTAVVKKMGTTEMTEIHLGSPQIEKRKAII